MEHFEIVLALCRSAVQARNPGVLNHLRRLVRALKKDGCLDQAELLAGLDRQNDVAQEIQPSRVVLSFVNDDREALTKDVKPPVDRETSTALANIIQPDELQAEAPVFDPELSGSIGGLLEEWRNVDRLLAYNVQPAMSLMVFGAPGTGKTMLAHFIAQQLQLPLVVARLDGLVSSFLGTTARNISNLFAFAHRYRCILLLDEFDAIAKLRDDPNELGELKRVVNTLLQCLDSRSEGGFTIAITNHQSLLDPAVWRRFDIRIQVPKPNFKTRVDIVKHHFEGSLPLSEPQIEFLAWLTSGYSGADIQRLAHFVKRHVAINGAINGNFVEVARRYVQLSASDAESKNREAALGDNEDIAFALSSDPDSSMSQEELANLFGKAQTTISRWLKDRRHTRA